MGGVRISVVGGWTSFQAHTTFPIGKPPCLDHQSHRKACGTMIFGRIHRPSAYVEIYPASVPARGRRMPPGCYRILINNNPSRGAIPINRFRTVATQNVATIQRCDFARARSRLARDASPWKATLPSFAGGCCLSTLRASLRWGPDLPPQRSQCGLVLQLHALLNPLTRILPTSRAKFRVIWGSLLNFESKLKVSSKPKTAFTAGSQPFFFPTLWRCRNNRSGRKDARRTQRPLFQLQPPAGLRFGMGRCPVLRYQWRDVHLTVPASRGSWKGSKWVLGSENSERKFRRQLQAYTRGSDPGPVLMGRYPGAVFCLGEYCAGAMLCW